MTSPSDLLRIALQHHQAGRLSEAEAQYRRIVKLDPAQAEAVHHLGLIAHQTGRGDRAIELMRRSIALKPTASHFHKNLAIVLTALGRFAEAEACCRHILARDPNDAGTYVTLANALMGLGRFAEAEVFYRHVTGREPGSPEAHYNLGGALQKLGRFAEAEACYREALRFRPSYPEALSNLGDALHSLGRFAEAEACCREALRLNPDFPAAHNNLGHALQGLDRLEEAEASFRAALRLQSDFPDALNNLGNVLHSLGRFAEAQACCREALRLNPDFAQAHNNLGCTLQELDRFEEAEACYRRAVHLKPDFAEAHNNLGSLMYRVRQLAAATACYREALRINPDHVDAHMNLASVLLSTGNFDEGWAEYEWRLLESKYQRARRLQQPAWRGEEAGERTLLLHAEQGLGDSIHFSRYVPLVGEKARVVLEVPRALVRLLATLPGKRQIIAQGETLPPCDLQCSLMSLPFVFKTSLATIPAAVPYLAADPDQVVSWRRRLATFPGLRVGLIWAGNPQASLFDRRRSLALDRLTVLADIPEVTFVSLQKGEAAAQRRGSAFERIMLDWTQELTDFVDTAALIEALDLVISVDTSVAHLAGALGKPIWLLNRFDTDWRWLLGRDDSPWYPSLRQFRQPMPGDWDAVIARVAAELSRLAASRGEKAESNLTLA